jgi:hypothetical protein
VHPRIILTHSILDEMMRKDEFWSRNYQELYIKLDDDNLYFLDIFDHPQKEVSTKLILDTPEGRAHTVAYFKRLVTQVDAHTADHTNIRIKDKYVWFARQLNQYLRELRRTLPREEIPLARE